MGRKNIEYLQKAVSNFRIDLLKTDKDKAEALRLHIGAELVAQVFILNGNLLAIRDELEDISGDLRTLFSEITNDDDAIKCCVEGHLNVDSMPPEKQT